MDIRLSISISPSPPAAPLLPSPEPPSPAQTRTGMPAPPEATYQSQDQLYTAIQAWAAQHRYAFRIGRSYTTNKSSRKRIYYECDRCGPIPPRDHPQGRPQARKRRTTTRKTGCQFSIIAVELSDAHWELRHRVGTKYNVHNHPPSHSITSHPEHRKLAQEDINKAKELHNAGKNLYYITFKINLT